MIGSPLFAAQRFGRYPELAESPSPEWDARYSQLMTSPWLARKTDRARRLREHAEYLMEHVPEILFRDAGGLVVDLGPGCGELLELARLIGCETLGIDAACGFGGMGNDYVETCRMLTERQGLPVDRCGFDAFFADGKHVPHRASAILVNSRGSIEQMLHRHMEGEKHHLHQDCRRLRWRETGATREAMEAWYFKCRELLMRGGIILVAANGSQNDQWYDKTSVAAGTSIGLRLIDSQRNLLHKWIRED